MRITIHSSFIEIVAKRLHTLILLAINLTDHFSFQLHILKQKLLYPFYDDILRLRLTVSSQIQVARTQQGNELSSCHVPIYCTDRS